MKEKYSNIFKEDIVVPDIVQRKAEEAYMQIKERGTETMNEKYTNPIEMKLKRQQRIIKYFVGACACVALFILAGHVSSFRRVSEITEKSNVETYIETVKGDELIHAFENMFTLKAYAADSPNADEHGYVTLNAQDSILVQKNGLGCVLSEGEDDFVSYCIGTNFLCEGENIESITYSINGAAFQVVERPNESILIASEPYDKKLNTGLCGGEDSDTLDNPTSVFGHYKSFTLSYDNQMNDYTWINICNETEYSWDFLYGQDMTLEDRVSAIEKMMEDVEIICTVQYTDGTISDAHITIGGGITTAETGVPQKDVPYADFEFRLE